MLIGNINSRTGNSLHEILTMLLPIGLPKSTSELNVGLFE